MSGWRENLRSVEPYVPGEQPGGNHIIKLNTNENPYPPAPGVARALQSMDAGSLRKYPNPGACALADVLAEYCHVKNDQIFVGVGSDDVLALAFLTFFNSRKPVLFPDVTYSFYKVWADLYRIPYETPPLDQEFNMVKEHYFKENGGVIFPNPNAPTGILLPIEEVEEIVSRNQDVVVIVDEAYIDFGGVSAIKLVERYENLLVVQTFSKSRSLAGMRIGFAVGSPELIRALNNVKYSFNSYTMNTPSQILGVEAVKDEVYFNNTLQKIIRTREEAKRRLGELGFRFPDSMANFLFASHEKVDAAKLYEELRRRDIYVRYFPQPRLDSHLRITVGTDEEMEALYSFLKEYLSN